MKRSQILIYLVFTLLLLAPIAMGQEDAEPIEPTDSDMMNPEAHISYPPPVYVVRDSVDIRGTVTLETMRNFFIEFRPLVLDMMMDAEEEEENQWFPATLPRIEAVTDDVLGTWNTVTLRDGLYELRLQINIGGDAPEFYRVSPIRVENNPPPFAAEQQMAMVEEPAEEPADEMADDDMADDDMADDDMADDDMAEEPEEAAPEPEPTEDPRPRVISMVNANVRAGDSTAYGVIGFLLDGESALVKGISSRGSGWYYIELANGRSGFIYPFIVNTEGDLSNLAADQPATTTTANAGTDTDRRPSTGAAAATATAAAKQRRSRHWECSGSPAPRELRRNLRDSSPRAERWQRQRPQRRCSLR